MTRVGFVVFFLRLVFGCVAVVAALMLALAGLIFDDPAASHNPFAWNLALAPLVYIALYALSVNAKTKLVPSATSGGSAVLRALLPLVGILWYGIALLFLQLFCGGSFGCRAHG
jgi:hypothetical protein